jgi:hypothetical protein
VQDIDALTAAPRRYGFHATLKPPFRLANDYAAAADAARVLAAGTAPFRLPPLYVADMDGFLALRETEPCPALQAFADSCVMELDAHRAPATADEIRRRRPERLSTAERQHLERWGYPYVFENWRFHLTLSRRLSGPEMALLKPQAEAYFASVAARPRIVRELCLFTQATADAPFLIAERLPLGGA